jgi:hypothetical protein
VWLWGQVWVEDAEKRILAAIRSHGQILFMNMQTQVVIVKLSTHPAPASLLFHAGFLAMTAIAETI